MRTHRQTRWLTNDELIDKLDRGITIYHKKTQNVECEDSFKYMN